MSCHRSFARAARVSSIGEFLLFLCGLVFSSSCHAQGCVAVSNVDGPLADTLRPIGCGNRTLGVPELVARATSATCENKGDRNLVCTSALRVDGLKGSTIDGDGWQITFVDPRPGKGGIVFGGASNVVIRNLKISWLEESQSDSAADVHKRIHSKGTIRACPGGGSALELDKGGNGIAPVGAVSKWSDGSGWPWDIREPGSVERYFLPSLAIQFSNGKSPCVKEFGTIAGRVLVRHHIYSSNAFNCYGCEMIGIEKVTIHSAPGMGFYFLNAGKGFVLRQNVIAPTCGHKCSSARPSIAADGIHFAGAAGSILIEGNDFGWQGDDSVNVTGVMLFASVDKSSANENERWLRLSDDAKRRLWLLKKGGEIALFDRGLKQLGTSQVIELDKEGNRVRVSRVPPDSFEFFVTATDRIPHDVLIRNNHFHDHRGRGILAGASNTLIENNSIERVTMAAVMIHADTANWLEGPGARNVMIVGNNISQVNAKTYQPEYPSAISVGFVPSPGYRGPLGAPIQDVTIENNSFSNVFNLPDNPVHIGCGVINARVMGRSAQGVCTR